MTEETIRHLDDAAAIRLLSRIAQLYARTGELETDWTPELQQALLEGSGLTGATEPVSEGDLARQALLLLAEDPGTRDAVQAQRDGPTMRSFDAGTLLFGLTAALVVLQTRFEVKRDEDGKLTWRIGKEAVDSTVLKTLIEKVLSFPFSSRSDS